MFGISPGHTPSSLMFGNQERTSEATITKEQGLFGQPDKIVLDAGKGNDAIEVHTNFDGSVDVSVNGKMHSFSAEEAKNLEIRGGKGDDTIVCTGEAFNFEIDGEKYGFDAPKLTLDGGNGNDRISGSKGDDVIRGGKGNDTILGGDGNDNIDGGRGHDTIMGGHGKDTIKGGRGNDNIMGGFGDDTIDGGRGHDSISGGDGKDTIKGGRGNDRIWGDRGNDTIHGDRGNDTIHGGAGDDSVFGGSGRDNVFGDAGKDWVKGDNTERNFFEEIFDMPSEKDHVDERNLKDILKDILSK
jgi:Ca2+-binding RTX toxin-like protein